MVYDPVVDLQLRHAHIHLAVADIGPAHGALFPEHAVIILGEDLTPAERRTALAHEIAHLDLKHAPSGLSWFDLRQEAEADKLAARRLISLVAFAEAVMVANDDRSIARYLDVEPAAVRLWRSTLTPAETAVIEARISTIEHVA